MLSVFTVAFFGHRQIENPLQVMDRLEEVVRRLIREKAYVEFLVGRSGDFDQFAASAVRGARRALGEENSSLTLVLPYLTAECRENQASFEDYYSQIEVSQAASLAHPKAAHQIRNREVVDRADLIICCIDHESGGAWQTVAYARKQGKAIINLAVH